MQTDILIIGGGPTGLLSAALAKQLNMNVCVIDKQDAPLKSGSHAHYLNAYSIEILVAAGIPYEQLIELSIDADRAAKMVVCHRLCHTIGYLDLNTEPGYQQQFRDAGRFGAHLNIPTEQLHTCLFELVKRLQVDILYGHCPKSINIHKRYVTLENRHTQANIDVFADYILACDGASSQMANLAGIPLIGQKKFMPFQTVECRGSLREIVQHEAMIYWIYHEAITACMVAFDLDEKQILQIPLVGHQSNVEGHQENFIHRFAAACGKHADDMKYAFQFHDRWLLQTGVRSTAHKAQWLFILGDALHQVLPAGGLGLNTGIADVYNLIWKLKARHDQAIKSHVFLDTYEKERIPAAVSAVTQSIENYQSFMKMSASMVVGLTKKALLTTGLLNNTWVSQQWQFLNRHYHESLDKTPQQVQSCLDEIKTHYDGAAMHYQVYYNSGLTLNPSNRRYYDLKKIPKNFNTGMRIINMRCLHDGSEKYIYDLTSYRYWTLLCFDHCSEERQVLTSIKPVSIEVFSIEMVDQDIAGQVKDIQAVLIRPDLFVFSMIGANVSDWEQCAQALKIMHSLK